MHLLGVLVQLYSVVVLIAVVGSWVDSRHWIFEHARRLSEPALEPIRKLLPPAGGFDLSSVILLVILQFVSRLLLR